MTFDDGTTGPPDGGPPDATRDAGPNQSAEATTDTAKSTTKTPTRPALDPWEQRKIDFGFADPPPLTPKHPDPWRERFARFGMIDPIPLRVAPTLTRPPSEIDARERAYALGVLRSEAEELARTTSGRNGQLNVAAFTCSPFVNTGALTREEVEHVLTDAARVASGLGDHPLTENEIAATLRSGLDSGAAHGLTRYAPENGIVADAAPRAVGIVAPAVGDEAPDDDQPRRPWQPVDLGPVLSGGWQPSTPCVGRRSDGVGLAYPGKVHTISSETEAGKTWMALIAASDELRRGDSVLYIDFEDDEGGVVGRLLALQVPPDLIRQHFHYVRPTEALGGGINLDDLRALIKEHRPVLVVIDGITEAMTMHGLNPLDNKDIADFGRILPRRLANAGPAVVCLDHVTKSTDTRGRYAIGGVHKLNGLDGAAYILENREPFGIGLTGRSTVLIAKDRPGQLRKHGQRRNDGLHTFAELIVTSHDVSYVEYEIRPIAVIGEEFMPTTLMAKISDALNEHGAMTQRQILATVKGKRQYAIDALALLQRDGYVSAKSPHERLKPYPDGGRS